MARRAPDALKEVIRDFRRDQIIETSRQLFGERGTTEVSMDEIANQAGVARSTVYVYFANRDELLQACVQSMYDQLKETISVRYEDTAAPLERLRALICGVLERIDESPAFFRLAMATQATTTAAGSAAVGGALMWIGLDVIRLLEDVVGSGVEAGDLPAGCGQGQSCRAHRPADLRRSLSSGRRAGSGAGRSGHRRDLRASSSAGWGAEVKFDLWMPTASPMTTFDLLEAVGRESEDRGIATVWVGEHVVLFEQYASSYPYAADGRMPAPSGSGLLEPMVTLSYLAACTKTVRLGTAMLLLPQRNPVYTAKEVSSLDWLSGGPGRPGRSGLVG